MAGAPSLSGTLHGNGGNKPWSWDGKNNQGQHFIPGSGIISVPQEPSRA